MKRTSLREFELTVSLLRTLGQVVDVRWRWLVPENSRQRSAIASTDRAFPRGASADSASTH